jgi:hypothetical protein
MQTIETNMRGPIPSAKKVLSAPSSIVSTENKNICFTTPFQNRKAGDKPGVSELSAVRGPVLRCQNPCQAPFKQTGADRMRETVRKFRESLMYSLPAVVREQAVDTLSLLIRFDSAISMDDSKVLIEAVKIINRAGVAHT